MKALSEEEERILKCWKRKEDHVTATKELEKHAQPGCMEFQNYKGPDDRFFQTLTREQALLRSTPPEGSLQKAIRMTRAYFPDFKVVSAFDDIPDEFFFHAFTLNGTWNDKFVLVAFMYRYHEHVMRHGVYLKVCQHILFMMKDIYSFLIHGYYYRISNMPQNFVLGFQK
jgi:hypothetical protein